MHIQCISKREDHSDLIYGTGKWNFEEVKDVPDDVARKMLDHKDVYVRHTVAAPAVKAKGAAPAVKAKGAAAPAPEVPKVVIQEPDGAPLQEFYDQLSVMTKDQARSFIEAKFNLKVDARKYPSEQAMRDYARLLVDQYGMV